MSENVPVFEPPTTCADTYTSRPVSITAMQWDGSIEGGLPIMDWAEDAEMRWSNESPQRLTIETLEGRMSASPGDWIIRGTEGEYYPCKDSVFKRKYLPQVAQTGHSSFLLSEHEYAENSFYLSHFTGQLLVGREDLEEAYRQLDAFLHPNLGFAPRIAKADNHG